MKNILFLLLILLSVSISANGQVADGITYQAVALDDKGKEIAGHDVNGQIIHSKQISVRFSILSGTQDGEILYKEVHSTYTDQFGLFTLVIGHGDVSLDSKYQKLIDINWGADKLFLKVEIDIRSTGDFKNMGIQQMMAVPFAFHSLSSSKVNYADVIETPTYRASDFDTIGGVVSIDYVNATAASGTTKGFLTSDDWNLFNEKAGINFNIDRPITLSGTNTTGINLGAGGKTMSQFLEAFFFPPVAATPPGITFTTATTIFPYSVWKNWGTPPLKNDISFSWSVNNLSQSDGTDDKPITSIKLKNGTTELISVTPVGGNQSGIFSPVTFANPVTDPKVNFNKIYTLEVIDAQPNTVSRDITLTMSAAIPLSYSNPVLTPSTLQYEYDIIDKDITVGWSITQNDETISSITVDGNVTGSTSVSGSQNVKFKTIANGGSLTKSFPLTVTGNIYGDGVTRNTPVISWENRLYRGTVTSATPPGDPAFTFTDNQVKTELLTENKLGGNWKSASGYDFVCGSGGQYVAFAFPDEGTTPVVQYYDSNFNSWMTYPASDLKFINRTGFVNQNGYNGTNYKVVFVCVQYFSTTVKIRLQ